VTFEEGRRCPRNCRRRAKLIHVTEAEKPREDELRRRPASQETCLGATTSTGGVSEGRGVCSFRVRFADVHRHAAPSYRGMACLST